MNASMDHFTAIVGFIFGVMFTLGMFDIFDDYTTSYRMGQIDAMNGKVVFELKTAGDGTTQWMRIEK